MFKRAISLCMAVSLLSTAPLSSYAVYDAVMDLNEPDTVVVSEDTEINEAEEIVVETETELIEPDGIVVETEPEVNEPDAIITEEQSEVTEESEVSTEETETSDIEEAYPRESEVADKSMRAKVQNANNPPSGMKLEGLFRVPSGQYNNSSVIPVSPTIDVVEITPNKYNMDGTIWSEPTNMMDLTKDFTGNFHLYFGNDGKKAADGVAFVMHNDPNGGEAYRTGAGSRLGVWDDDRYGKWGIALHNSLAIEFDTYYKNDFDDNIANEHHIAWNFPDRRSTYEDSGIVGFRTRKMVHRDVQYPGNIANDQWHDFMVRWEAKKQRLAYKFGTKPIVYIDMSKAGDTPLEVFGTEQVYWGFTGSTGGEKSHNRVAFAEIPHQIEANLEETIIDQRTGEDATEKTYTSGEILSYDLGLEYLSGRKEWTNINLTKTLSNDVTYMPGTLRLVDKDGEVKPLKDTLWTGKKLSVPIGTLNEFDSKANVQFDVLTNKVGSKATVTNTIQTTSNELNKNSDPVLYYIDKDDAPYNIKVTPRTNEKGEYLESHVAITNIKKDKTFFSVVQIPKEYGALKREDLMFVWGDGSDASEDIDKKFNVTMHPSGNENSVMISKNAILEEEVPDKLYILIKSTFDKNRPEVMPSFDRESGYFKPLVKGLIVIDSGQENDEGHSRIKMLPPTGTAVPKTVKQNTSTDDLNASDLIKDEKSMLEFDTVDVTFKEKVTFDEVGKTNVPMLLTSRETGVTSTVPVEITVEDDSEVSDIVVTGLTNETGEFVEGTVLIKEMLYDISGNMRVEMQVPEQFGPLKAEDMTFFDADGKDITGNIGTHFQVTTLGNSQIVTINSAMWNNLSPTLLTVIKSPFITKNRNVMSYYDKTIDYFKPLISANQLGKPRITDLGKVKMMPPTGEQVPQTVPLGTSTRELVASELISDEKSMLEFDKVDVTFVEEKIFDTLGETSVKVKLTSKETGVSSEVSVDITVVDTVDNGELVVKGKTDETGDFVEGTVQLNELIYNDDDIISTLITIPESFGELKSSDFTVYDQDDTDITEYAGSLYWLTKTANGLALVIHKETFDNLATKLRLEFKSRFIKDNPRVIDDYDKNIEYFTPLIKAWHVGGSVQSDLAKVKMLPPTGVAIHQTVNKDTSTDDLDPYELVIRPKTELTFDTVDVTFKEKTVFTELGDTSVTMLLTSQETGITSEKIVDITVEEGGPLPEKPLMVKGKVNDTGDFVEGTVSLNKLEFDVSGKLLVDMDIPEAFGVFNPEDLMFYGSNGEDLTSHLGTSFQVAKLPMSNTLRMAIDSTLWNNLSESLRIEIKSPFTRSNPEVIAYFDDKTDYFMPDIQAGFVGSPTEKDKSRVKMMPPTGTAVPKTVAIGTSTDDLEPTDLIKDATSMLGFDTVDIKFQAKTDFDTLGETSVTMVLTSKETGVSSEVPVEITVEEEVPVESLIVTPKTNETGDFVEGTVELTSLDFSEAAIDLTIKTPKEFGKLNKKDLTLYGDDGTDITSLEGTRFFINEVLGTQRLTIVAPLWDNLSDSLRIEIKSPFDTTDKTVINFYDNVTGYFNAPISANYTGQEVKEKTSKVKMLPPTGIEVPQTVDLGTSTDDLDPTDLINDATSMLEFDTVDVTFKGKVTFDELGKTSVPMVLTSKETGMSSEVPVEITVEEGVVDPAAYIILPKEIILESEDRTDAVSSTEEITYVSEAGKDIDITVRTAPELTLTGKEEDVMSYVYKSDDSVLEEGEILTIMGKDNPLDTFSVKAKKSDFTKQATYKTVMTFEFWAD